MFTPGAAGNTEPDVAQMAIRWSQLGRRFLPPGLWEGPSDRRWVTLTFDDGPDPGMTPAVLAALRAAGAPATFFFVGSRADRHPDLVQRAVVEGHEVGNHTWAHRPLAAGWKPEAELRRTEALLSRLAPGSARIFRPPFGAVWPGGYGAVRRLGLLPIYWSVLPGDWDPLTPAAVERRVLRAVHPGAVICLHAGRPWHGGTARAIEPMVDRLRERGYEIVPLRRMLEAVGGTVAERA